MNCREIIRCDRCGNDAEVCACSMRDDRDRWKARAEKAEAACAEIRRAQEHGPLAIAPAMRCTEIVWIKNKRGRLVRWKVPK